MVLKLNTTKWNLQNCILLKVQLQCEFYENGDKAGK